MSAGLNSDQCVRTRLDNGVRVARVCRPEMHSFVISAYVGVGSQHERPEHSGLTHFVEHMLFQGTETYPAGLDLMRAIDSIGGNMNGMTSVDFAAFSIGVHRKYARQAVQILADILLRPVFDPNEIEQERAIIQQERAQFHDQRQRNLSVEELAYNLMWRGDQIDLSLIGTDRTIRGITRDMLLEHWQRYFVGSNTVLCVAGAFDADEIEDTIAEQFGHMTQEDVPALQFDVANQDRVRSVFRYTPTPTIAMMLCHRAVPFHHADYTAYWVVAEILGGGICSRLFTRVREELGLVYDIAANLNAGSQVGSLDIYTNVGKGNCVATLEETTRILDHLSQAAIESEELELCREKLRCGLEISLDDPFEIAGWYGRQELLGPADRVITFDDELREIEQLQLEDVRRVAGQVFQPEQRTLAAVGPVGMFKRGQLRNVVSRR